MSVKTLSLIVFDSSEAEWLIPQACTIAADLEAHLTVLHAYTPVVFYDGMGGTPAIYATVAEWEEEESKRIKLIVDKEVKAVGILAEYRRHTALYGAEPFLFAAARGADLVLAGSNGVATRSPDDANMLERLVRNLGRPVLILGPNSKLAGAPERLLIGWSDTKEATRAAHDALAFAKPGAQVQIVAVQSRSGDLPPGLDTKADFAAAIDRLGYRVSVDDRTVSSEGRVETLIQAANEIGADVIVVGAFGHSQLYDFVIGAVTRELLTTTPLPVFLSN